MRKYNKDFIWNRIQQEKWDSIPLIIRSSAKNEDTMDSSMAGKYNSTLNVCGKSAFYHSVTEVIHSYGTALPEDQILCQPMLKNVAICGVCFTVDPNTGGNYYIINYATTGSTDAITSGIGKRNH